MSLSAKEAADAVGMTKQGIIKSIRNGRLSASKDEKGQWRIDPAELFRVYKAPTTVYPIPETTSSRWHTQENTPNIHLINTELRVRLEAAEAQNKDLRSRLEKIEIKSEKRESELKTEKEKLLALIERQSLMLEHEQASTTKIHKGWFGWLKG